jgi:anti-sigma-K factor RskA
MSLDESAAKELLHAHALGCLEQDEADALEEHLETCASCRSELEGWMRVAGRLASATPPVDPPVGLEARIMRAVGAGKAAGAGRKPLLSRLLAPAALAAAALVILLAAGNLVMGIRLSRLTAAPRASGLQTVVLAGTDRAPGAFGIMILDRADRQGVVAIQGLPALDAARQYQLWLIRGDERRSGGVFSVNAEGYGSLLVTIPAGFTGLSAFGVTVEPAGGSPGPTGAKVMGGRP